MTTLTGRNFDASSLHTKGDSSDICERIFRLHFNSSDDPANEIIIPDVLDLTYGKGVFWKWLTKTSSPTGMQMIRKNDLNHETGAIWWRDFTRTGFADRSSSVVVFDPPFMSSGAGHYNGFGNDRSIEGAPQNRKDTRALLVGGLAEAMRLARTGIIVKTQVVVESKRTWNNPLVAELMIEASRDWYLDDIVYQHTAKRRQPPERVVEHFQGKPSIWLIAKRRPSARKNPELKAWLHELADKMI